MFSLLKFTLVTVVNSPSIMILLMFFVGVVLFLFIVFVVCI
jgi:hypothetical protein